MISFFQEQLFFQFLSLSFFLNCHELSKDARVVSKENTSNSTTVHRFERLDRYFFVIISPVVPEF